MRLLIADTRPSSTGGSPEDLHREEVVEALIETLPGIELSLILPGGIHEDLTKQAAIAKPWQLNSRERFSFIQRKIPRVAETEDTAAILTLFGGAPLRSPVPVISYLPSHVRYRSASFFERLVDSLGMAGVKGAKFLVGLQDQPVDAQHIATYILDPWVDRRFAAGSESDENVILELMQLEPGFALAYGFRPEEQPLLLAAWSWVVGSTGDSVPLVLLDRSENSIDIIHEQAESLSIKSTLRIRETPPLASLPALLRQADVFLHGEGGEVGQALRWALVAGCPIAAIESPHNAAIVGDAAYLTPAGNARALGAAILSIIVQEDLAQDLRQKSAAKAAAYRDGQALRPLVAAIQSVTA